MFYKQGLRFISADEFYPHANRFLIARICNQWRMHFGRRGAEAVDLTQSGLWAVFKIVNHMPME